MAIIQRNRTIRPSTRKESSKSYKVETTKVLRDDTLVVNINHETLPFKKTYNFKGSEINGRKSISFRVDDYGTGLVISWSEVIPY
jgi:hypothetical protein